MRVGTITFHAAFNYGSMLQAWALQYVLRNMGCETEIINFRSRVQKKQYAAPISFSSRYNVKQSLKWVLQGPLSVYQAYQKWNRFNTFLQKNMVLSAECGSIKKLRKKCDYDVIIAGSDQIWNTSANDFSEAYFVNFAPDSVKRIAYAPSFGPSPEGLDFRRVKELLKKFSAVSVREERGREVLTTFNLFDQIAVVLDPTMLLSGSEYEQLISKTPLINGEYIFYYTPGPPREEFLSQAEQLGAIFEKKVVCESFLSRALQKKYPHVMPFAAVGPSEFLNLIKNSYAVCGASFHLMVFSILFKRNFFCFNGDVDSRMNNLMKLVGLESQIISLKSPVAAQINLDIDYERVYKRIETLKKDSMAFIRNALQ